MGISGRNRSLLGMVSFQIGAPGPCNVHLQYRTCVAFSGCLRGDHRMMSLPAVVGAAEIESAGGFPIGRVDTTHCFGIAVPARYASQSRSFQASSHILSILTRCNQRRSCVPCSRTSLRGRNSCHLCTEIPDRIVSVHPRVCAASS